MADIIITPVASSNALTPVAPESAALNATQDQIKPLLAALPSGSVLQGFVLNRDASGNPLLRTPQGDFSITSPFFLKIGSEVVLRITGSGQQARAHILTVDGLPPQEAEAIPAHEEVADVIGQRTATPAPETRQAATAGTTPNTTANAGASQRTLPTLEATLLRPAPLLANTNAAAPLPQGTQLRVQLIAVESLPHTPGTPATAAPNPTSPAIAAAPSFTPPAASTLQQYSAYVTPAAEETAQAPAPPLSGAAAAPATTPFTAIVLHTTPIGETVVSTPLGDMQIKLPAGNPLPPGSQMTLQMLPAQTAEKPAILPQTGVLPTLAQGWDTLEQIVAQLSALDDVAAQSFLSASLPQWKTPAPGTSLNLPQSSTLGNALMVFISALTGGDFRSWLGARNVALLENAGRGDLLEKAEGEFNALRQLFNAPQQHGAQSSQQPWQALFLPIMTDEGLRNVRFYTRRERNEKRESGKATQGDTRFVVETELSQIGAVQLDGFIKNREGGTQFDLMVRSQTAFTESEKNDIRILYNASGELTGFTGTLLFQHTQEFPVHPMEELLAQAHTGVVA